MAKQIVIGNLKDVVNKWYYTDEELDEHIQDRAKSDHTHDYYTEEEIDKMVEGKAEIEHTHTSRQIVNLHAVLDDKAPATHTHDDMYKKTDVDTKVSEMETKIKGIEGFRTVKISSLNGNGEEGVLYLLNKSEHEDKNSYDEYIWYQGSYERVGSTDIELDMSAYVTEKSLTSQLTGYSPSNHEHEDYMKTEDATTQLATKAPNTLADVETNGLMSSILFNKLAGIEEQANKTVVDDALSESSTNPLASQAVQTEIDMLRSGLDVFTPLIEKVETAQNTTVKDLTEKNTQLTTENQNLQEQLESLHGSTDDQIKNLREQVSQLEQENEELESTNSTLTSEKEQLEQDKTRLESENATLTQQVTDLTGDNESLTAQVTELTNTNNELNQTIDDIKVQISLKADKTLASATNDGLMSKDGFNKLSGIAEQANKITVDTALSTSSTNPVRNSAINSKITELQNKITTLENKLKEIE